MRKSDQAGFMVNTVETGDGLKIEIDAVHPDGSFRDRLPITVNAVGPENKAQVHEAKQSGPGQYLATIDLPARGTTIVSISSPDLPDGGTVFGHTRSYPREFLTTETNEVLLRRLAQIGRGRFAPTPEEVFRATV